MGRDSGVQVAGYEVTQGNRVPSCALLFQRRACSRQAAGSPSSARATPSLSALWNVRLVRAPA
jgi:hypothetical protein